MSCATCKSSDSLEQDEGMRVCTKCGTVVEESGFVMQLDDRDKHCGMSNPDTEFMSVNRLSKTMRSELLKRSDYGFKHSTSSRRACFDVVDRLCDKLNFNRNMRKEIILQIKQSLVHESFHKSEKTKTAVAAIAAYITMIRNDRAISVADVCSIADCDRNDFAANYYNYLAHNPQHHPGLQSLAQMIPHALKHVIFHADEKNKIYNVTENILTLLDHVMLIESKSPSNRIIAASFIAWKSLKADRFTIFCSEFLRRIGIEQHGMKSYNKVPSLAREFESKLKSMATQIPWLTGRPVSTKSLYQHFNDILTYKNSVVHEHKKQVSCLPVKRSISPVSPHSQHDVDGDGDISDAEIDTYIRSPREVALLKRLKTCVGSE